MIERKLIEGRWLNLSMGVVATRLGTHPDGTFVTQQPKLLMLEESDHARRNRTSNVAVGTHSKMHRNFQWLTYQPGIISQMSLSLGDVMTGFMSGCWLTTYRANNGVVYAAHVGTGASDTQNAAVKGAWNAFATQNPLAVIGGFNPKHYWDNNPHKDWNAPGRSYVIGLMTKSGEYYSIFVKRHETEAKYQIKGVSDPIASVSPYELQHI